MCDPLSIATFAISAGSSFMKYEADQYAADQQNETYRQNAYAANKAAQQQAFDINQRMLQEQEAAAGQKEDQYRQVQAAQATAAVAAGEAGVSGLSVDALLREFSAKGLRQATASISRPNGTSPSSTTRRPKFRLRRLTGSTPCSGPQARPSSRPASASLGLVSTATRRSKTGNGTGTLTRSNLERRFADHHHHHPDPEKRK